MIGNKYQFFGLLVSAISYGSLSGAIFCEIDTSTPLKCVFSDIHQNRIAVDNGRVEKVIFTDDSIAIRMEEESGQVFVVAVKPTLRETVLSLVTDKGIVQDFEIKFEDRSSEVVILQDISVSNRDSYPSRDIGISIDQILSGQTPEDYCCFGVNGEQKMIGCGILLDTIARFDGCKDTVNLIHIVNPGNCKVRISEQNLCSPSTQWVYLVKDVLSSQEETVALVCERKVF